MEQGFLAPRRRSPASLAAIVAVHAGVVAVLATSVSHIRQVPPPPVFQTSNVDDPPPPPPPPRPQPTPHSAQHATTHIDTVPPLVLTPSDPPPVGARTEPNPVETTAEPGNEATVIEPVQPPVRNPVLVDAGMDPRFAADLQPPYPTALERAGTEGTATVRVLIGADGRVHQVEQVAADDPLFFEATQRQALHRWRFKPATRDGTPIDSWKTLTVRFRIQAG